MENNISSFSFETVKDVFLQCSKCFLEQASTPRGCSGPQCHLALLWGHAVPWVGGAPPALICRTGFDKQPVNSQFRLVIWSLLALVSPLVAKPSMLKAASLEGRPSLILGPLLPFLSSLQVSKTSFLAFLTFAAHLTSVWSLRVGTTGCLSELEGTVALPSPVSREVGGGSSG